MTPRARSFQRAAAAIAYGTLREAIACLVPLYDVPDWVAFDPRTPGIVQPLVPRGDALGWTTITDPSWLPRVQAAPRARRRTIARARTRAQEARP